MEFEKNNQSSQPEQGQQTQPKLVDMEVTDENIALEFTRIFCECSK